MRVFVDGSPVSCPKAMTTLAQALEAGRVAAATSGRIIVLVLADGDPLEGDALDGPIGGISELRLTSEDPRRLVREALDDAAAALDDVRRTQRDAAELIHRGEPGTATQRLAEVVGVWEGVKRVVDEGGLILGRSLEREAGMDELLAGLTERLTSVKALLGASDWAGLADELAYDLDDEAARWRGKMLDLSGMLA